MQKTIEQNIIEQKKKASLSTRNSLLAQYFPQYRQLTVLQFFLFSIVGSLAITLGAKINIPLYPVHTTMQMFAVMVLGCAFGSRLALASVIAYLAEGFCGLPVFMGSLAGPLYFAGPTAGYLFGFMLAAYGVGFLYERGFGHTLLSALILFALGAVLIDIPGVSWLYYLTNAETAKTVYLSYQLAFVLKTGLGAVFVTLLTRNKEHHHHNILPHQP